MRVEDFARTPPDVASVSSSEQRPAAKPERSRASRAVEISALRSARNLRIRRSVAAPSLPQSSNSSRSKLLETWMSMLGLRLGSTSASDMSPRAMVRHTMSLRFEATTRRSTGRPMRRAACAA
jgi:hypothetical protein